MWRSFVVPGVLAYDPSGRAMEMVSEGKTAAKVISHYGGPGATLTWTSEGSGKWVRNIPGIDGELDAIQTSGGAPVLQLHDPQRDIVSTAALDEMVCRPLAVRLSIRGLVPVVCRANCLRV